MHRIVIGLCAALFVVTLPQPIWAMPSPQATTASVAAKRADAKIPNTKESGQKKPAAKTPGTTSAGTKELEGETAVKDLRAWYQDVRSDCGATSNGLAPAFLCTGVMLRATTVGSYLPWNPNPASTGVSFSWLRTDTNFSRLAFDFRNGFIFYPKDKGAPGSTVINVLCVFPMDADTSTRANSGCGKHPQGGDTSAGCSAQGINSGQAWFTHFNALPPEDKYRGQCGWNVRPDQLNAANRFMAFVQGRSLMPAQWWAIQNELRMASWAEGAQVPIRAFFYLSGDTVGLANARSDQTRYKSTFGTFAPIVRLTLPMQKGGQAEFEYDTADQAIPDPGLPTLPEPGPDTTVVDFEKVPLGGGKSYIPLSTYYSSLNVYLRMTCPNMYIRNEPATGMRGHHLDFLGEQLLVNGSIALPARTVEFTLHADSPVGVQGTCGTSTGPGALVEKNGERYRLSCASGSNVYDFKVTVADGKAQMDDLWLTK